MSDIKNDGEIHPLSEEFAYISEYVERSNCCFQEISRLQKKFLKKYADYLYEFNKEKAIEMILENIENYHFLGASESDFQMIYRPPYIVSSLATRGCVGLKFKRSKNDKIGK